MSVCVSEQVSMCMCACFVYGKQMTWRVCNAGCLSGVVIVRGEAALKEGKGDGRSALH